MPCAYFRLRPLQWLETYPNLPATRVQREHQAPPDHSMLRRQHKQTDASNPRSSLVFFSWILAVQLTGLAAFTKGFFLTRVELGRQSECDVS